MESEYISSIVNELVDEVKQEGEAPVDIEQDILSKTDIDGVSNVAEALDLFIGKLQELGYEVRRIVKNGFNGEEEIEEVVAPKGMRSYSEIVSGINPDYSEEIKSVAVLNSNYVDSLYPGVINEIT